MSNTARSRVARSRADQAIRPSDDRLLQALLTYHFLTPAQMTRLHFSPGAEKHVYAKLRRLAEGNHVQAIPMLRQHARGSSKLIYTLARSGLAHLHALGIAVPAAFRLHRPSQASYLFYAHQAALSDVLIAASLLGRSVPHVRLAEIVHDRELARSPVAISLPSGERVALVPDAFLAFHVVLPQKRGRYSVLVEVDRGTVDRRSWERRIAAYAHGEADGSLPSAFGVATLTVAIVVPDRRRQQELVELIATVLGRLGLADQADLFLVSAADPVRCAPTELFLSPVWAVPGTGELVPLLEAPEVVLLGGEGGT